MSLPAAALLPAKIRWFAGTIPICTARSAISMGARFRLSRASNSARTTCSCRSLFRSLSAVSP